MCYFTEESFFILNLIYKVFYRLNNRRPISISHEIIKNCNKLERINNIITLFFKSEYQLYFKMKRKHWLIVRHLIFSSLIPKLRNGFDPIFIGAKENPQL